MELFQLLIWALWLAVPCVVWSDAEKRQRRYHIPPATLSPLVWAVIVFVFGIIGLGFYIFACVRQGGRTVRVQQDAIKSLEESNRLNNERSWDKDYWNNIKLQ